MPAAAALAPGRARCRSWRRGTARRWAESLSSSRCSEQPTLPIAGGIELRQCRHAAADGRQHPRLVRAGHGLGADAIAAVGELIDAPQLFGCAGEWRGAELAVLGCRERTLRPGDRDPEK